MRRLLRSWIENSKTASDKPSGAQIASFISILKSWIDDERVWFIYVNELQNERERNSHSLLVESENFHQPFILCILGQFFNIFSYFVKNNFFFYGNCSNIENGVDIGTMMIDLILGKPHFKVFQDEWNLVDESRYYDGILIMTTIITKIDEGRWLLTGVESPNILNCCGSVSHHESNHFSQWHHKSHRLHRRFLCSFSAKHCSCCLFLACVR